MSKDLGRRVRKPVKREGFVEEEEFDRILMEEYGITAEELEEDIRQSDTRGIFKISEAEISLRDGTTVLLHAQEDKPNYVFTYLEGLASEDVTALWNDTNNRRAIGSLIRYPGELHEWLMVAALPLLKQMQIPLVWMKEFRTPTSECLFRYMDKRGQEQIGFHGGEGSGFMHISLLRCYTEAYKQFVQGNCQPGYSSGQVIAKNLSCFAEQHYKENSEIPEALVGLINRLTQA